MPKPGVPGVLGTDDTPSWSHGRILGVRAQHQLSSDEACSERARPQKALSASPLSLLTPDKLYERKLVFPLRRKALFAEFGFQKNCDRHFSSLTKSTDSDANRWDPGWLAHSLDLGQ